MPFCFYYKHNDANLPKKYGEGVQPKEWVFFFFFNVIGSLTAGLDAHIKVLLSVVSVIATGGKCHSYEWRTGGWSNNQRVVWCQRSDGVNVTGEKLLSAHSEIDCGPARTKTHTQSSSYKYLYIAQWRQHKVPQFNFFFFFLPFKWFHWAWAAKTCIKLLFFLIFFFLNISTHISPPIGICWHCHDIKWIFLQERAVTVVILLEVDVANSWVKRLEWISSLDQEIKKGTRVATGFFLFYFF